jgi:hypothetical protein
MSVTQTSKYGSIGGASAMGPGLTFSQQQIADPDIAAQGAQAQKLAQQQIDYKNNRFNQIFPAFKNAMGAGAGAFGTTGVGTDVPMPQMGGPHIQGGPLYTQQAIQQNLNANRAQVDQSTATNNRNMQSQLAGKGYGSGSPLAFALQNQANMSGLGQKADYTRQFTDQARQGNAQFGLQAANAQQNQFAQNQQAQLGYGQNLLANARNQITAQGQNQQYQSSLLNALSGLM